MKPKGMSAARTTKPLYRDFIFTLFWNGLTTANGMTFKSMGAVLDECYRQISFSF